MMCNATAGPKTSSCTLVVLKKATEAISLTLFFNALNLDKYCTLLKLLPQHYIMALNPNEELSPPLRDLIDNLRRQTSTIEEIVHITKTPGLSLGVIYQGSVVYAHSLGKSSLSQQSPCTADTPFAISSLTKSFTATACALLVLDGSLDIGKILTR
jgi:CubicO group peptidase (beta-lactamase class C family)